MLDQITPVVLTRDEEINIERTLRQLTWARDIVVVDSFSIDRTVEMARAVPKVRVLQREFDSIAGQSVFGVANVTTPWVLLLDADYFVPGDLVEELRRLEPADGVDGYVASFRYAIDGRLLHASLYPPRIVLLRRDRASIWQDGHTPRIAVAGSTRTLHGHVVHDDRKDFRRFVARQRRYMAQEAEKLHATPFSALPPSGRIRKLVVVAPFAVVVHTLLVRGVILDGWAGLRYTWERFVAECILSWSMLSTRNRRPETGSA